jgi:prohibitin 1
VVAEFDAGELITQREIVSARVNTELTKRAEQFGLILDDISLTHLTFGRLVLIFVNNNKYVSVRLY